MPFNEFHYTPTGTGVISGKEVLEQTEDAINDLGTQISGDVQTAIDTANNALNTANTASADAQNAVNTANTAYTAATNAQNTANTAQGTATSAQNAATAAQNDVDALETVVTGIDGRLTTTEGNVTNLTTRMGTAEGNITTLQNDVVTAQGTATSAQNTATLARGQAYVVRYASVAVSDNSTVPYTDLNNTDNIKANDLLLDTNGKFYQITSVDTVNETVSVTTPLTQLAVDSGVLHKALAEIITGEKTFLDIPIPFKSSSAELGVSGGATKIILTDKNLLKLAGIIFGNYSSSKLSYCRLCIYDKDSDNQEIENFVELAYVSNNQNAYLRPNVSNFISLGTTSNRWKDLCTNKINGLEPSALGMPVDRSSRIDILGSFTNMGTGQSNSYTAPANGYIYLNLSNVSKIISVSENSGGLANYANTTGGGSDGQFYVLFPIRKNDVYRCVWYTSSTVTVSYAYFLPCQGNV